MQTITRGVIPAAGLGTRLYPMTKAQPKEMLPIGGRPMIYYAMLEAALSGLEEIYIVINKRKDSLRHYLTCGALQRHLQLEGGGRGVCAPDITFLDQPAPLGSGEALYRTREMIGEEPFALMMPDFLLFGSHPALAQMIPLYERFRQDTVAVLSLEAREATGFSNVGVVQATQLERGVVEVHSFSGKSRDPLILKGGETILKVAGRWIVGPHIFSYLERTRRWKEEWDDAPALQRITHDGRVIGKILAGRAFDVGNPLGYRVAREQLTTIGDQALPP